MKLSNLIEEFIQDMINTHSGVVELQRNLLASRFGCVPSQINYVISTRFSPERGYIVESRRGGGGYIKITRTAPQDGNYVMHAVNTVGETLTHEDAKMFVRNLFDYGIITKKEAKIILAALAHSSIPINQPEQNTIRAAMLKNILINL